MDALITKENLYSKEDGSSSKEDVSVTCPHLANEFPSWQKVRGVMI